MEFNAARRSGCVPSGVRGGRSLKYCDGDVSDLGFALLKEMRSNSVLEGTMKRLLSKLATALSMKCAMKCEMRNAPLGGSGYKQIHHPPSTLTCPT
jgi:hypothetical protein